MKQNNPSQDNHTRVTRGIQITHESLARFAQAVLKGHHGKGSWFDQGVRGVLSPREIDDLPTALPGSGPEHEPELTALDFALVLKIYDRNWRNVFCQKMSRDQLTWIKELQSTRNRWALCSDGEVSSKGLKDDDAWRALDTMARLLEHLPDRPAMEDVRKLASEVRQAQNERVKEKAKVSAETAPAINVPGIGPLKPWRQVATPHADVAEGRFHQAEFAADLAQVLAGKATSEYQDPIDFFSRTYITEGISQVLTSSLERVAGSGGEPVVQLKTPFGGGKTHTMLALYHFLGTRANLGDLEGVSSVLERAGVSRVPEVRCALLVGTALSVSKARRHKKLKESRKVHTLWGELAAQIAGDEGYDAFAQDDRKKTPPGSDDIQEFLDRFGPCLILLDEALAYFRILYGSNDQDLAAGSFDANLTFIQNLTEGVKRSKNGLLVASIPQSELEIGGTGGEATLERLEHTFGRLEAVWKPVSASEGFEIVRRRLFNPIQTPEDTKARDQVCQAFWEMYKAAEGDFPPECRERFYLDRLQGSYPIHPEFFDRLYGDWSSLERFQRTRGVLRLMAATIHTLWSRGDTSLMIQPSQLPLDEPRVRDELTRYLSDGWNSVVDTDVDGDRSLPYQIDRENTRYGRSHVARRVARTVFLGSAPTVREQKIRGIETIRVRVGAAQPGENVVILDDGLATLRDRLSHLYEANRRYWYDLRPNLRRTVEERATDLKDDDHVLPEIESRLRRVTQRDRGQFHAVHTGVGTADVPDEAEVRLVVLGPTAGHRGGSKESRALESARDYLENRGSSPRQRRNMLVFVASDEGTMKSVTAAVRQHLAWKSIVADTKSLNLDAHQMEEAELAVKDTDSTIDLRIQEAYFHLLIPRQDVPPGGSPGEVVIDVIPIRGSNESFVKRASRRAFDEGHVCSVWNPTELKADLERWLWGQVDHVSLKHVWTCLTKYTYFPRLKDQDVFLETIRAGVKTRDFFGYAASVNESGRYLGLVFGEPSPPLGLDEHAVLVRPAAAQTQQEKGREEEARKSAGAGGSAVGDGRSGTGGYTIPPTTGGHVELQNGGAPLPAPKTFTRFHAHVDVDPVRLVRDAEQVAKEVVAHLEKLPDARVRISIEIEAEMPDGVSEATVRAVTENCRVLNFGYYEFEE